MSGLFIALFHLPFTRKDLHKNWGRLPYVDLPRVCEPMATYEGWKGMGTDQVMNRSHLSHQGMKQKQTAKPLVDFGKKPSL